MAEEVRFGPDRHRFCDKLSRVVGQNELFVFSPCYQEMVLKWVQCMLGGGCDLPQITVMQAKIDVKYRILCNVKSELLICALRGGYGICL